MADPADSVRRGASSGKPPLYIVLVSVHGLIRGENLELGRDADTGGQVKYVVEMARALANHSDVGRVDLLTRRVIDRKVSSDYAVPEEQIAPDAYIVRLPCGPKRYFRKEVLWPYLDGFVDEALRHVRRVGRAPDVIHGHYADAGYVGARLAGLLGVPFFFTGHSLGRVKRRLLREEGVTEEKMESYFRLSQRIEAEEEALETASRVIVSTQHEIDEQYVLYDHYRPGRKLVIPPGTDLSRFHPPGEEEVHPPILDELARFLSDPDLPMVLTLARPDERKNLRTLVRAYAVQPGLRERANLVVMAGNRDNIREMGREQRRVLTDLLLDIDCYDLYGHVALPKQHEPDEVPELYRLAARSGGVFVLPTTFELFGLTMIEAAASGLPVVATENGGPQEIVAYCENGLLVDPLDAESMGASILDALDDRARWGQWSERGARRAKERYAWKAHIDAYLAAVRAQLDRQADGEGGVAFRSRMPRIDRLVVCDIDNTLLGDDEALQDLFGRLREARAYTGFGIATGRTIEGAVDVLRRAGSPLPDVMITSVGTEVYYGPHRRPDGWPRDRNFQKHISYRWKPDAIRAALDGLPGLELQPAEAQRTHKISYYLDVDAGPSLREVKSHLRRHDLSANVIFSHGEFLDVIPIRASKGRALRYLALRWGLPPERILVAGDSGNDEEMLRGNMPGVIVGNHSPELEKLRGDPHIYFAEAHYAAGILEGLAYYDFLGDVRIPSPGDERDGERIEEQESLGAESG